MAWRRTGRAMKWMPSSFFAMTGALSRIDIRGRNGQALSEAWARAEKLPGAAGRGLPNLFTVTGPGSPSVLTNMLPSIEQHVRFIGDAIADLKAWLRHHGGELEAQEAWIGHVNELATPPSTRPATPGMWRQHSRQAPCVYALPGPPAYCEKCDAERPRLWLPSHRAA